MKNFNIYSTDVLKDGKGRILKPLKLNANPTFNPDVVVTSREGHSKDGEY